MSYMNHNDLQDSKIVELGLTDLDDVSGGFPWLAVPVIVLAAPVVAVAISGFIDGVSGNERQTD